MRTRFQSRREAGELLASKLALHEWRRDSLVLALPRGGLPVAFAIAEGLELELNVLQVNKLGIPGNEALAMGAVTEEGVCVLRPEIIASIDLPAEVIEAAAQREQRKMKRAARLYHSGKLDAGLAGRIVIVADDGLVSGATMQAAVRDLRRRHPARIVVALPLAMQSNIDELQSDVDEVHCLMTLESLDSVEGCYIDCPEISDGEIKAYLSEAEQWRVRDTPESEAASRTRPVSHPTASRH